MIVRLLTFLSLVVFAAGCATPSFVMVDTPVPASAKDSRDDGILRDRDGRPVRHNLLGQTLPEFAAEAIDGSVFSSGDLAGKWTVLAAWGVWCHDSRNDAEHINALAKAAADDGGIEFVSIHMPFSAEHTDIAYRDYGSVEAYFEAKDVSWPTIIDEQADIRALLEIQWTPSYLVVGPDMTVRAFRTDFSVTGEDAVAAFVRDVKALSAGD
ncbi:MAG: TlpA disulfide reductase family protein [Hyphomonadaceae bacterium]